MLPNTRDYGDRDWDTYRNHRIGFVFQSYNLIPHQTVSENVELALNISGVDRAERIRRAHEALDKVGLAGQYNKRPNQLSGGQCQRVAIARALVNDPEILLADEPTGALDTATSVQIMDLIREVADRCLVIMVTHNPDIAKAYSTRIIRLLDGSVVEDTAPFDPAAEQPAQPEQAAQPEQTEQAEQPAQTAQSKSKGKNKKSKLSFWSAFRLSAKNLLSKFKRTFLVCLAGSIGIIGVATVLAVSTGVRDYIESMQDDMLSGNPVTVSEEAFDMTVIMSEMTNTERADAVKKATKKGYIDVKMLIEFLASRGDLVKNSLIKNDITEAYVNYVKAMPQKYYAAISEEYGINFSNNLYTDFKLEDGVKRMSLTAALDMYTELLKKTEFSEYTSYIPMVTEKFKQAPDNADFILSQYDIVSDRATSKIASAADEIMIVVSDEYSLNDLLLAQFGYFSQDEFLNLAYKAVGDEKYDGALWKDKFSYDELMGKTFTWYPNDSVFDKTANPVNPFTYNAVADEAWQGKQLKVTAILKPKSTISYGSMTSGFYYTSALAREAVADGVKSQIAAYLDGLENDKLTSTSYNGTNIGLTYSYSYVYDGETFDRTAFVGSSDGMSAMFGSMMGMPSVTTYTLSLRDVGGGALPSRLRIYPTNFDFKDEVCAYLDAWNGDGEITVGDAVLQASDRKDVTYTDNLAIVIGMINSFIDIVTAALVAFTALSLVVSTVMVAIITYVSVIERVKEIGVIRSLGGRKRDVSALFNAETFIIGGVSGVIGVTVTYIISAILNAVISSLFGIHGIAHLTVVTALVMIAVSIALTLISGLIPAWLAAKKDPVDALRSE